MTYPPTLYAALHRGNPGDIAYYRAACEGAASVLELGCGYGRVLAELADVVEQRWGLDEHPGLIALAAETTTAALKLGTMQAFSLERTFDRIIIPYNGLYCLLTDADVQACLSRVRAHLAPGGRLIFDVYPYDGPPDEDDVDPEPQPIVSIDDGDVQYTVWESVTLEPSDVAAVTYRYAPDGDGPAVEGVIRQRGRTEDQLRAMLAAEGFVVEQWLGGFMGESLEDPEQWIVNAYVSSLSPDQAGGYVARAGAIRTGRREGRRPSGSPPRRRRPD